MDHRRGTGHGRDGRGRRASVLASAQIDLLAVVVPKPSSWKHSVTCLAQLRPSPNAVRSQSGTLLGNAIGATALVATVLTREFGVKLVQLIFGLRPSSNKQSSNKTQ